MSSTLLAPSLDDYRNAPLERQLACERHWSPDFSARAVNELARFLALKAELGGPLTPSEPVDAVWHALLLRTRDYEQLCADRLGCFVHHTPLDDPDPDTVAQAYARTRLLMERRYGELDEPLWPANAGCDCN